MSVLKNRFETQKVLLKSIRYLHPASQTMAHLCMCGQLSRAVRSEKARKLVDMDFRFISCECLADEPHIGSV